MDMKKSMLCKLGLHKFGKGSDGEGPDPANPTRRAKLGYCLRYFCNKVRVNGKVVSISEEVQAEREANFARKYVPLPPAPKGLLDSINKAPRVPDEEDEFLR
jgi:hypothetical protein